MNVTPFIFHDFFTHPQLTRRRLMFDKILLISLLFAQLSEKEGIKVYGFVAVSSRFLHHELISIQIRGNHQEAFTSFPFSSLDLMENKENLGKIYSKHLS